MSTTDPPGFHLQRMGQELDRHDLKRYQVTVSEWTKLVVAVQAKQWGEVTNLLCHVETTIYNTTGWRVATLVFGEYQQFRSSFLSSVEHAKQAHVSSVKYPQTSTISWTPGNNDSSVKYPQTSNIAWTPGNNDTRATNVQTNNSLSVLQSIANDLASIVPQSVESRRCKVRYNPGSEQLVQDINSLIPVIQTEITQLRESEQQSAQNKLETSSFHKNYLALKEWITWLVQSMTKEQRNQPRNYPDLMPETNQCITDLNGAFQSYARNSRDNLQNTETVVRLQAEMKQLEDVNRSLKQEMKQKVEKAESEKQYWMNRVSKVAGTKLTANNPAITDLSDPNRPGKIAERYGELYDNLWTEAMETLHDDGRNIEQDNIKTLTTLLKGCFEICEEFSKKQKKELRAVLFTVEDHHQVDDVDERAEHLVSKGMSDCRKEASSKILPALRQVVLTRTKQFLPREVVLLPKYIAGCVDVCWTMVLQEPNLCFVWPKTGEHEEVNTNLFSSYTRSGRGIEFVVWPAMLLHENGPLLRKGTVQPFTKQAWPTQRSSNA